MPRRAKRIPQQEGAPTAQYSNRIDLARADRQPVRAPTGMGYGEHQALVESQQAAPLPQAPGIDQVMAAAKGMPFPDVTLGSPTQNPREALTAGLAVGAGPGPEILTRPRGAPTVASTLTRLAASTGDMELLALAQLAEAQGA